MLQPNVPIVYTVSSAHFYSPEFNAIHERAIFQPTIKLHEQGKPEMHDLEGYKTMQSFVRKRLLPDLITDEALNAAITASGGIFREMGRIMRGAIGQIRIGHQTQIEYSNGEPWYEVHPVLNKMLDEDK